MDEKNKHTQDKREAKEQKRQDKIKKQKDKEAQLQRDISLMKKEIEQNKQKRASGNGGDGQGKKPKKSTIIIIAVAIGLLLFFFGNQFVTTADSLMTDELTTSEFIQAVEQDRVQNVIYNSGEYMVHGSYTPSTSIGQNGAEAFNDAIGALNDGTLNIINPVQTQNIEGQSSPVRNYKATFVGQDSLLELMQKHPNIQYEIVLPSG